MMRNDLLTDRFGYCQTIHCVRLTVPDEFGTKQKIGFPRA